MRSENVTNEDASLRLYEKFLLLIRGVQVRKFRAVCLDWVLHPQVGSPDPDAIRWHRQSLQAARPELAETVYSGLYQSGTARFLLVSVLGSARKPNSVCYKIYARVTDSSKVFKTFEQPKTPT
ncbi:hypothetical protein CROQUDRAFT_110295 [Cronartium quercuum f. sp. fusiforme G11]|uniref:Uncharacterized protein n=1 Tax=Cronartium quercuum f. sp. fusiforme G11 TaxID=708437 RepID=A0A9P6N8V0_9BASI|nr:hypothetical protein CROQUDRAFT_110295 [Cronartium quercuum f. sp. fusiforme G11]